MKMECRHSVLTAVVMALGFSVLILALAFLVHKVYH